MFYCNKNVADNTDDDFVPCDSMLESDGSDSRQEWSEEFFHCPKCGTTYTLRTEYKIQSTLVESEQLVNDETGEIVE